MDLFNPLQEREFEKLNLKDGELWYMKHFLSSETATEYFRVLSKNINWKQKHIKTFGKTHRLPRKTAWYGCKNTNYNYSSISCNPEPWTAELLQIKKDVEQLIPHTAFNSVLLNLYQDGKDKVGWHADDEKELGKNPVIASISLGATRRFDLKHKTLPEEKLQLELPSGSLIIMKGTLQHHWLHQIPIQRKITETRINLTYRTILF